MTLPLLLTPPPAQEPPTFLKWCGSKATLAPHLLSYLLPALAQGGRYFEPFLGSAAVYFHLRACGWRGQAFLSDVLAPLVNCYERVSQVPDITHDSLLGIERHYRASNDPESYYYQRRDDFNANLGSFVYRAALFLWINQRGFNGLWRTNQEGHCTTPWGEDKKGTHKRKRLPSLRRLSTASFALQGASLFAGDFEASISQAQAGDVIYADPPYAVGFNGYAGRFDSATQARLARCLHAAHQRGATIVASNSDTPEIRELYSPWCEIVPVSLSYSVGGGGSKEGREVILVAKGGKP